MYCDGQCPHLEETAHRCRLTGERLTYAKIGGPISFEVHEHKGVCSFDEVGNRVTMDG